MASALLGSEAAHLYPLAALCAATGVFALRQNRPGTLGGRITAPKAFWLNYALITFFAMPWALWRNAGLDPALRSLFGRLLLSFVLRGAVELPLIYGTLRWRCVYGIGHNIFTIILAAGLRLGLPELPGAADGRALDWLVIYQISLLVESYFAWSFGKLADPFKGEYFADGTEKFRNINRISWAAVIAGYGALGAWLWGAGKDFV